uniref:Uncharacterized protein n=1 Tax=Sphaerodactylus townsendi TaxID=933632 RepID=A0ACB8FNL7_9SAUR
MLFDLASQRIIHRGVQAQNVLPQPDGSSADSGPLMSSGQYFQTFNQPNFGTRRATGTYKENKVPYSERWTLPFGDLAAKNKMHRHVCHRAGETPVWGRGQKESLLGSSTLGWSQSWTPPYHISDGSHRYHGNIELFVAKALGARDDGEWDRDGN